MKRIILACALLTTLGGCTTISNWFADKEEIKIRTLKPIKAQFEPKLLWEHSLGDGVADYFSRLSPAVGYDKVFAADRQGLVQAFDQKTGKKIWENDFETYKDNGFFASIAHLWEDGQSARISGGLVASYDKVFFGTENGEVIALDQKTGKELWRTEVEGEVVASPAVDLGLVVVNTTSGSMFALDADTGKKKWQFDSEVPPLSLRGTSQPAITAGGVLVGSATGKLTAVIADNGQTAWEEAVTAPSGSTELQRIADIDVKPLILGGVVYTVSYNGTLAAVELRSGRVMWKREYKSYRHLTVEGNNLFLVDNDSVVYALDRRNGVEKWSNSTLRKRMLTGAAAVDGYLVVGDKFGFLHWMRQSDGEIVARMDVGGDDEDASIYAEPVVDGRILYTQTRDGDLVAIKTP